jgi:hypothetical protein
MIGPIERAANSPRPHKICEKSNIAPNSISSDYDDASESTTTTMSSKGKQPAKAQRSAIADVVAREYTIHLHKRVRHISIP